MLLRRKQQPKPKAKQAIVVSPFGFLQAFIRVYIARHDIGAKTTANYSEAMKNIEEGGFEYFIIEILGDALNYPNQVSFLSRFLNYCHIVSQESSEPFKIIVITPIEKEKFIREFSVPLDYVVNKNHDWYESLSDIIYNGCLEEQRQNGIQLSNISDALDELSEDDMLALMESRMKGNPNRKKLIHDEIHDTH